MSARLVRGRLLDFLSRPQGPDDTASYRLVEDGGLLLEDGRISARGDWADVRQTAGSDVPTDDYSGHLVLPGFIDPHIHFVQMQVVGSYAANLLEWLTTYTFVEEQKFSDEQHGRRIASRFFDVLVRHGTTTAAAYCSVHPQSVDGFFAEAAQRNMLMIGGKCMMDRECPDALQDTPETGYADSRALFEKWHGKGRAHYAITPRFAITSTPEQMDMVSALIRDLPGAYIQTHLSENEGEIARVAELFPQFPDYLAVYEHFGLLGPKSLFGHAIHLGDRELGAMAETGSVAVSCPTSNLFLGSGLFDLQRTLQAGVPVALATDIGGGTSFSMFRTADAFYKVQQMLGNRFDPLGSFYQMTLGNASALSLADRIGTLEPGSDADLVVLDLGATPEMALRQQTVTSLPEQLFVLQTLGDDRSILETYVAGVALKGRLA